MDEVMERIQRIKKCLEDPDDEIAKKKEKQMKQQKKNSKEKNSKNKIQKKSKVVNPKEQKTFSEVKSISDIDDDLIDQSDVSLTDIKEMQQRMQSHLVNLTKIIIKNQTLKTVAQEINPDPKKNSFHSKKSQLSEEETIKQKKAHKKQPKNSQANLNGILSIDEKIPLPINFTNQKISTASNSSFLLHENDFPKYYNGNHPSTFSFDNFMNNNATHSILKKPVHSNEANLNFDSKSDLKTSDLNSVNSLIESAKKIRSKKAHFSSEDDRIPGEILMISSENKDHFSSYSNDSDILNIPYIPEKYNDGIINNRDELISASVSSDNESNDEYINDVEINDELKARYLDSHENTNTRSFTAIESPILKRDNDFDYGVVFDMNNFYDIGSDEGYQASLEDY